MRDHTKAFCRLVAETFACPGPVYEFGSYQVEGQLDYADLRTLFGSRATEVIEMPGDHFPIWVRPQEIADVITRNAGDATDG